MQRPSPEMYALMEHARVLGRILETLELVERRLSVLTVRLTSANICGIGAKKRTTKPHKTVVRLRLKRRVRKHRENLKKGGK